MKVKDYFVPKNFEEVMSRGIPGFNNLEKAQRANVAFYIWWQALIDASTEPRMA